MLSCFQRDKIISREDVYPHRIRGQRRLSRFSRGKEREAKKETESKITDLNATRYDLHSACRIYLICHLIKN